MAIRFSLRHGSTVPTTSDLNDYEFGYSTSDNSLYLRRGESIIQISNASFRVAQKSDSIGFLKKTAASAWTIDTTSYLPLTGGTLTGNLTMGTGNLTMGTADTVNGTQVYWISKLSDSTDTRTIWAGFANGNNSWYLYDPTNGTIISSLATGVNTFNGNATTATSATKDGDGNVITDTYLPLDGGTLTGNLTINKSEPLLYLKHSSMVINSSTAPSSATGNRITFLDKNGSQAGAIRQQITTANNNLFDLFMTKPSTTSSWDIFTITLTPNDSSITDAVALFRSQLHINNATVLQYAGHPAITQRATSVNRGTSYQNAMYAGGLKVVDSNNNLLSDIHTTIATGTAAIANTLYFDLYKNTSAELVRGIRFYIDSSNNGRLQVQSTTGTDYKEVLYCGDTTLRHVYVTTSATVPSGAVTNDIVLVKA